MSDEIRDKNAPILYPRPQPINCVTDPGYPDDAGSDAKAEIDQLRGRISDLEKVVSEKQGIIEKYEAVLASRG